MVISGEDQMSKVLHQEKGYGSSKLLAEFPQTKRGLNLRWNDCWGKLTLQV